MSCSNLQRLPGKLSDASPWLLCHKRRVFSTTTQPTRIVVVGAGITGLTAAYHLARKYPTSKISVLEGQSRAGGWMQSYAVDLGSEYGRVVLEGGPRSLRPVSKALLELIHLLGLEDQLIMTPKSSPAGRNRLLYLSKPDGNGLKSLPSKPLDIFTSSFFWLLVPSVITERYWPPNRPKPLSVPVEEREKLSLRMKVYNDESVDSFLTRRFGAKVARIFGSALVHGIYAADSRLLSVRASFPSLWDAEDRGRGSVITGIVKKRPPEAENIAEAYQIGEVEKIMKDVALFSFKNGLETLASRLQDRLATMDNVEIHHSTPVTQIQPIENTIQIHTQTNGPIHASHVVSTIPLPNLNGILHESGQLPHLTFNPSSSVTVVNLVFPCAQSDLHPTGFGYLIPRSPDGYKEDSLGILGVVFDSCALSAQDLPGSKPITKLTLMCGGPSPMKSKLDIDALISELFHQLRRPRIEPIHVQIHQQTDCIPTPLVGHLERMEAMQKVASAHPWNGRLLVTGAGVHGVSIGDCIESGRRIAKAI